MDMQSRRTKSPTPILTIIVRVCLVTMGIGVIVVLLGCLGMYIFGFYIPYAQAHTIWQNNKSQWMLKGSPNYILVVAKGGGMSAEAKATTLVQNDVAIKQVDVQCAGARDCYAATLFKSPLTVEDLFGEAENCIGSLLFRCSVEYDPVYGYPASIQFPCIMDCMVSWTRVTELTFTD